MPEHDAVDYILKDDVAGWLEPVAAEASILLARHVPVAGRPVAEIGVHHGKYAIMLGLLAGGRVVGFDLFEDRQGENVDGSGGGDRESFLANAHRHGIAPANIRAVAANSMELDGPTVLRHCGAPPVFFSVDGGHTADLTENDLRVADGAVADDGIVALDDVFHEGWPSVMVGLSRYLMRRDRTLVPCAIAGRKVFLARGDARAQALMAALLADHRTRIGHVLAATRTELLDWPVTVLRARPRAAGLREALTSTPQWLALRRRGLARPLRALARRRRPL
jgi:hypothetical protein